MPVSTEYFGVNKRSLTTQWSGRYRVFKVYKVGKGCGQIIEEALETHYLGYIEQKNGDS